MKQKIADTHNPAPDSADKVRLVQKKNKDKRKSTCGILHKETYQGTVSQTALYSRKEGK